MTQSQKILNVALFEGRHEWPSIVTEYIYKSKEGGYDPRDFTVFEGIATIKMLKWKAEGVVAINLYLSGLIAATIAVLNAAYSTGIYVKLFHYSNTIDAWIPQTVEFLHPPLGIILKTPDELETEERERRIKEEITNKERHILVSYTEVFNKLYHHYDPDRFDWEQVYSYIMREYKNVKKEYVLLMKPYFDKYKESEGNSYADVLRNRIEADRGQNQDLKPIYKLANKRIYRRKRN